MTGASDRGSTIPAWVSVLLALSAVATWAGAAIFAGTQAWPVALAGAALALLVTYITAWVIAIQRRSPGAPPGRLRSRLTRLMPAAAGGAALTLCVAAIVAVGSEYDSVFVGLCLLGAAFLGTWAVWASVEARRLRRRFGDLRESSLD